MRRYLSKAWLAAMLLLAVGCGGGGGGTTTVEVPGPDVPFVPDVSASMTVAGNCMPGSATVMNNGIDVCSVQLNLSLSEPVADFPAISVDVSGPAGLFFYSNPNTTTEPITSGRAPRSYSVSFTPSTGLATLTIYVRSTAAAGTHTLNISSGAALSTTANIAFAAVPPPPVISVDAVTIQNECQAGVGTVEANGIALCQVSLDLNMSPAQNGFQVVTTISAAQSGLLFYSSAVEPLGSGAAPRPFTVTFDGTGNAVLDFFVRSSVDGQTNITMASGAAFSQGATVEFTNTPPPPMVTTMLSVDPACAVGAPTAEANGSDLCQVTATLDLTPPQPFQLSLTASSIGDLVFYESAVEPIVDGRAPRTYLVNFDSVTGAATLDLFVRATSGGIAALDLDGQGAGGQVTVNESANVEFATVASPPLFGFDGASVDAGCQQGTPTIVANGTDVCQVSLSFSGTPSISVPVTVGGIFGWVFYDSAVAAVDSGAIPRIFMVNLDGTGSGSLDVFVRSTVAGTGDVSLSAPVGSVTGNTVPIEFDGSPIASTVTGTATPDATCAVGTSVIASNGLALCRIDVSMDLAPATTETRSLVVSGPAGYRFYASPSDALGTGQNPRAIPANFMMGMADFPVYVRSTAAAGSGAVSFAIEGSTGFAATTEFVASPPAPSVSAGTIVVDSACQTGGGATAIGNGSDNCLITIPLTVSPPQAHQAAIEVAGPAGVLFYAGAADASNTGQAPRNFLVDFDAVTGQASLQVYARAASSGTKSLTINGASGDVSAMQDVAFIADAGAPSVLILAPSTLSASCDATGTPTAEANGVDLCQVDITFITPAPVGSDYTFAATASGPAGWVFYPSGGVITGNGTSTYTSDVTIPMGGQFGNLSVYIRSTAVGADSLSLAYNGTTGSVPDIEFVTATGTPMITVPGKTVAAVCDPSGSPTARNNGVDTCAVSLMLNSPGLNGQASVELSGPAGMTFSFTTVEDLGLADNPRLLPLFWVGGNATLPFVARYSGTAGMQSVTFTVDGEFSDTVDIEFVETSTAPEPVISVDSAIVAAGCQTGSPTVVADGADNCTISVNLAIDPPQAYQLAVNASGSSQLSFYETTGDPANAGLASRDYIADFSPTSGLAPVLVVIRSNSAGVATVDIDDASGSLGISGMVEFAAPPAATLNLQGFTVDPTCNSAGTPSATANGSDVCQVTLNFTGTDGTYPVTVSGPAGWELFDAAMDLPGSGSLPRVYSLSVSGGAGSLDVFARSSVVGVNNLSVVANNGSVSSLVPAEFIAIAPPPAISGGAAVAAVCAPGTASAQNNGVDLCQVTLSLSRVPAEVFGTAASVSGPAGYQFYASAGEAIGSGQASRVYPVNFDAMGDATVDVFVRSTAAAGNGQLSINIAGVFALAPTVAFVGTQSAPTVMASATVDAACQQAASSTQANASDLCTVTLDLTVSPAQPFQLALNATGPAGVLFYDLDTDPLNTGLSARTYLANFDGVSGTAQVQVYTRSATAFSNNLVFTSTEASVNAPVEFIAVQSPPTVDSMAVTGVECDIANPTARNNGLDLCLITLTLTPNPLAPVDFALAVSGPVGYAFYGSDTDPIDQGSAPRVYSVSLNGSGPQDVQIWVRSTRAGQGTVNLVANGILNIAQQVSFAADGTFIPPELVIGDECKPAMATAQANGLSTCLLTLNLTLSPPDPAFFDIAVSVSSDSGYLFYSTLGEPVNLGQTTRIFPVSFDPDTGLASLDVYVRSNNPGIGNVSFASGGRVDITEMIEFDVDASAPSTIELLADSFVGDGGSSQVVAIVKNGNGDPIPSSAVQFTLDFTSNDPNGLFAPAHPTIVRAGQDKTDGSGEALVTFTTQNFNAHTVTITASISSPVVTVPAAQVMISVFDQVSAPSKAEYQVITNIPGRIGQNFIAESEGVDGFFGNTAGSADILQVDVQILSVDETSEGLPCDCDPNVDGSACTGTGAGQVACPLATGIELDCPNGLGNPTQAQCKFAADQAFAMLSSGCVNGISGSCFKFNCPGGATGCSTTLYMRVPSNSVAKQTGFPSTNTHFIRPRVFAGGAQLATNDVNRTDAGPGQTMLIPDSLLFLPDPQLPSDAFFTKPVCGVGGVDTCDTGAGDASDGGLNQNCVVLTTDAEAGMTVVSCSDNAAHYELPTSNATRPRVPVAFDIQKVLGEVLDPMDITDGNTQVSLTFDGPAGTGLTYQVCEGPGTPCRTSSNGDVIFVSPGTTLSQTDDLYLYPPFSPTPFGGANGISVSVSVPSVTGFAPATKKLLFNPECTTPVALQCEFAGDDALVPAAPPACFSDRGGRANAYTDGVECEYVECKVVSYAESVPGTGPSIGPTMCADEPVPDGLYSLFVADDGDTEVEGFCQAGDTCNVGSFTATRSLAISTQRARFYVQVNNNQTASPTIQADFLARLRKVDQSDLSPADLIELTPPFTMGRDPTLPASLAIAFEDSLAAPVTTIYTQHAASSTTAPELFNFYGMDASTKYGDPFAARVMVTIKDFNGNDYVNAGDNPTCQVRLSASGSAAGTTFPTLSAGDCDAPLEAPKTLTQVNGNPVVGACVISNGNVNAATATATVTAAFTGGCTTGMNSNSITVRSVPRSARFRYNVTNTAGSTVPFTGLQANADLNTTIFCTPSDGDCAGVPQPEDFFPVDLLAAKGPQGELLEDGMGGAETRALYSEIPPGTCANAFSIAGLATRGVWSFDLSLHPDPDGDGLGPGELLDRLNFDVSAIPVPTITSQEVTQRFNNVMFGFCDFGTISEVQFSILQGTPLYFGAP